jgi:hypothetical protein
MAEKSATPEGPVTTGISTQALERHRPRRSDGKGRDQGQRRKARTQAGNQSQGAAQKGGAKGRGEAGTRACADHQGAVRPLRGRRRQRRGFREAVQQSLRHDRQHAAAHQQAAGSHTGRESEIKLPKSMWSPKLEQDFQTLLTSQYDAFERLEKASRAWRPRHG